MPTVRALPGVKTHLKCWTDFKRDQNIKEELVRIDKHSAWFRKIEDVKVDQLKRLPPQDVNKAHNENQTGVASQTLVTPAGRCRLGLQPFLCFMVLF